MYGWKIYDQFSNEGCAWRRLRLRVYIHARKISASAQGEPTIHDDVPQGQPKQASIYKHFSFQTTISYDRTNRNRSEVQKPSHGTFAIQQTGDRGKGSPAISARAGGCGIQIPSPGQERKGKGSVGHGRDTWDRKVWSIRDRVCEDQ